MEVAAVVVAIFAAVEIVEHVLIPLLTWLWLKEKRKNRQRLASQRIIDVPFELVALQ